jgi:hypothetical protein
MPQFLATLFLALALPGCAVATKGTAPLVSIAQLATAPESFANALVRVRACAFTGAHGTLIFDCTAPNGPRFELEITPSAVTPDTIKLVRESLGLSSEEHPVGGTFVGTFQIRRNPRQTGVVILKTITFLDTDEP